MTIPVALPLAQLQARRAEIDAAIRSVLNSGRYILGPEVEAFESEFAAYIGVPHGVGVANGTDALHLALAACGIGAGAEVLTVAHTAGATVSAIVAAGATPVFIDIDPETYTLDPAKVEGAISPRTKAIIPVHLYGHPTDLPPLLDIARRHSLRVIEDCAQAHGARLDGRRLGSFGDLACFSFYPTKNLGAIGDGGMVVTRDADLAKRVRHLREYGWAERYISSIDGWNSRLDELQAAILRVKLRHLDDDNARRVALAQSYSRDLQGAGVTIPVIRPKASPVFHLYVVRVAGRDRVRSFLERRAIGTAIHYPVPLHLQAAYRNRFPGSDRLPETERAAREILSLPLYPELPDSDRSQVVDALKAGLADSSS